MHLGHLDYRSAAWAKGVEAVLGGVMDGRINVPIERVYPLDAFEEMFEALASRQLAGKALLNIG